MIVFPKSPLHPVSLFRIRWFNERDAHILTTRVLVDDPARSQARKHVRWKDIKEMVRAIINTKFLYAQLAH